ncbi:hypothetical protein GOODEAATRI_028474 [Goodea atripinnis]|uniref:Uncharacterized protein n=1 Tax=Goodea atripinnis TaxID=208336 RepID=A0ABV0NSA7_9TELE
MGGPVSLVSFCPFRRYCAHPPSKFLNKVRIKKTLTSGRPKFSLTVPHRDTLAVLVLSTLCPRFAIPLGGLREGCECATGSWVGSFRSYCSVLRNRAVKADLGQSRAQKAFHEADPRICRSGRSWVGSFRSYRSVLCNRAGKADLGQSRAQKASQEPDPRICRSGRRTEKNEPSVTSVGPQTPATTRGRMRVTFSLAGRIEIHWPCSSYPLCVHSLWISTPPNSGTLCPIAAKLDGPHPPFDTCKPAKAELRSGCQRTAERKEFVWIRGPVAGAMAGPRPNFLPPGAPFP